MEQFFQNNIYVLLGIAIYYLLTSERPKRIEQRIVIIYLFTAVLVVCKTFNVYYMILVSLICMFCYFELLNEDGYRLKIIRSIKAKIVDFFYLIFFKFHYWVFALNLILYDGIFENTIYKCIGFFPFVITTLLLIILIVNNDFDLYSFTTIYDNLNRINFGNFKKLDKEKKEILLYIEDKSFFKRKKDFTFLCWDFVKYRFERINDIVLTINEGKGKPHKLKYIINFILYIFKQLFRELKKVFENFDYVKKFFRGYSTIDMQLFRTVSVKNGYQKEYTRKIAELFYSQLIFKGLKDFYRLNYATVTDKYFKEFILVNYISVAPVLIGGKNIPMEKFWKKKIDKINNSEFFLSVLSFSGKIKAVKLSSSYIFDNFNVLISKFNLDEHELNNAIAKMKKMLKK